MSDDAKTEKQYKCPACQYVGPGIVKDIPKVHSGSVDSAGVYCARCLQDWFFRNIPVINEVKK